MLGLALPEISGDRTAAKWPRPPESELRGADESAGAACHRVARSGGVAHADQAGGPSMEDFVEPCTEQANLGGTLTHAESIKEAIAADNCSHRVCAVEASDSACRDAAFGGPFSELAFEQVHGSCTSVLGIGMPSLQSELARQASAAIEAEAWLARQVSADFSVPGRCENIMSAEYVNAIWAGIHPQVVREVRHAEQGDAAA